jgi:hypothetical protein
MTENGDFAKSLSINNPRPVWPEKIRPLEKLDGEGFLQFEYQHGINKDAPKTIMEIRASQIESVLDACPAIVFGLWEIQHGLRKPVGVFFGLEYRDRYVNDFISGSRPTITMANTTDTSNIKISEQFWELDDIHPTNQYGSEAAFELAGAWRDGRLSQIFLGVSLEVLARRNIKRVLFNDDRTIKEGKDSVYTRFAEGIMQTGRQMQTTISTQLTAPHKALLTEFIK